MVDPLLQPFITALLRLYLAGCLVITVGLASTSLMPAPSGRHHTCSPLPFLLPVLASMAFLALVVGLIAVFAVWLYHRSRMPNASRRLAPMRCFGTLCISTVLFTPWLTPMLLSDRLTTMAEAWLQLPAVVSAVLTLRFFQSARS